MIKSLVMDCVELVMRPGPVTLDISPSMDTLSEAMSTVLCTLIRNLVIKSKNVDATADTFIDFYLDPDRIYEYERFLIVVKYILNFSLRSTIQTQATRARWRRECTFRQCCQGVSQVQSPVCWLEWTRSHASERVCFPSFWQCRHNSYYMLRTSVTWKDTSWCICQMPDSKLLGQCDTAIQTRLRRALLPLSLSKPEMKFAAVAALLLNWRKTKKTRLKIEIFPSCILWKRNACVFSLARPDLWITTVNQTPTYVFFKKYKKRYWAHAASSNLLETIK